MSTMVLIVTFFSGIQLLSLGLLGEYIGRIYDEVKRRPLFIIDKVISSSNPEVKKFERLYTETY